MINIDYHEFVKLPPGTIFSYDDVNPPGCPRGLYIKGETIHSDDGQPIDYFETHLVPMYYDVAGDSGPHIFDTSRWGEYDYDQCYFAFEPHEVEKLRSLIS